MRIPSKGLFSAVAVALLLVASARRDEKNPPGGAKKSLGPEVAPLDAPRLNAKEVGLSLRVVLSDSLGFPARIEIDFQNSSKKAGTLVLAGSIPLGRKATARGSFLSSDEFHERFRKKLQYKPPLLGLDMPHWDDARKDTIDLKSSFGFVGADDDAKVSRGYEFILLSPGESATRSFNLSHFGAITPGLGPRPLSTFPACFEKGETEFAMRAHLTWERGAPHPISNAIRVKASEPIRRPISKSDRQLIGE